MLGIWPPNDQWLPQGQLLAGQRAAYFPFWHQEGGGLLLLGKREGLVSQEVLEMFRVAVALDQVDLSGTSG